MKIFYKTDETMEEDEISLTAHPNNKYITNEIIRHLRRSLNTIRCYDEYHNIVDLPLISIYYVEIIDHKIYAYTINKELRVCTSRLLDVKEQDKQGYLIQANATTLVNMDHVLSMKVLTGAKRRLLLDNKEIIIVTRTFKDNFKEFKKQMK